MSIFLDDVDYRQFVHLLGVVTLENGIRCWNYCVMPNHYHATLQPTQPNLSVALRRLHGVYGLWWNKRHNRVGHVFQGRFKDQIVDHESYALTLCRYVVLNPVRGGLVKHPGDWPWSSYRATSGRCTPPAFLSAATLGLFGDGDLATLQERFSRFVAGSEDDSAATDRIRSHDRILGDRAFRDRIISSDSRLTRV
jgi:REP element-mobilizing transposase RayT